MKNYCNWCHQADDLKPPTSQPTARGSKKSPTCPQCHRGITLVSIPKACDAIGMSKKTIYKWIDKGLVSRVRTAGGRSLICFSSLFVPLAEKDDEYSDTGPKK